MPRAGRIALVAAGVVLVMGIAAQLALPRIAENRLRSSLERSGTVEHVEVHAFPAVKLLWHRADDVTVRMGALRSGPANFADLLARTIETDKLDASAAEQRILTLSLHDSRLTKRSDRLSLRSTVTEADLRAALPPGFDVGPVASGDGTLVFEGTARLLGRTFSGQAVVAARNGRVLLAPNVPFGGFLSLTVFADPRIEVLDVGARPASGGFTLFARARLR